MMVFGVYLIGLLLGALAGILWGVSEFESYVRTSEAILDELMGSYEQEG